MKKNSKFALFILNNKWLVILFCFFVLLLTGYGGKYLGFNSDNRVFFSKENPQLKALEEIENTFTRNNNIYFALEPEQGDVFTTYFLSALEEFTALAWQIPYSSRVDSLANYQHIWSKDDDLIVEDLVSNGKDYSPKELERVKKIALSEPMLLNATISSKGDIAGVNVNILNPGKSLDEIPEIMKFANKMVKDFKSRFPNINVYITGGLPFDNAFGEVSAKDMATLVPLMYGIMVLVIGILLRSFSGAFVTLLIIGFATVTAMGITGWLGILLTPASAMAPTIILTLAVADSVHILATFFYEMRHGKDRKSAMIESLRLNMQPVFLTSLTTAIGFMSMNTSDAPPFRDLGNIVAIGVAAAYFYSILLLPALMSVLPVRMQKARARNLLWVDKFGDFVVMKRKQLFWGMLAVIFILIGGIFTIDLNDRFAEYFDDRFAIRTDTDHIVDSELQGMDLIEYSLKAGESNGVTKPEYLNNLEKLADFFRKQPGVVHVTTFSDHIKRLNRTMHGDDKAYYKIPEERALIAQYLLLYEMSLPFGMDLNNQINIDKSSTRFLVTLKRLATKELRQLENRTRVWMGDNLPEYMYAYGSGLSIVWAYISQRNIYSMLSGTFIALTLISAILMFAMKSFKFGLISLIPNLIPAFMAFGLWGYIKGEVGLAVSVVGAISLGIVVDDTIHFLSKYLRARREENLSSQAAVKKSFHTVGAAIVITSIVLVAGFFVLSFSGFVINSSMGLLTGIAICFALVADMLFLPPLLMKLDNE